VWLGIENNSFSDLLFYMSNADIYHFSNLLRKEPLVFFKDTVTEMGI